VRGLLPKLARAGFDAVEALTPSPAGDLEVGEMRAIASEIQPASGDGRIILWGGVPGVMFAPPFRWPDLQAHVARVLACWHGEPFILGVADQVPPDGEIEYVRRISELVSA
jgi:hypothetical protein